MAFNPYETLNELKGRYENADERRSKLGGTFDDYANGVTRTVEIPEDMRGGGKDAVNPDGFLSHDELFEKFTGFKDHGNTESLGENWNADQGMMEGKEDIGDGNFQLGDSGQVYLDKDTWEKHRNSDETWDLYAKVHGEEAAAAKREGNPEGLSASAFDGMIDKAYEGGLETPVDESIPETMDVTYKLSEHAQKAVERVKNYQEKRDTGYYNDMFSAGRQSEAKADDNHVQPDAYAGGGANASNFKAMDLDAARNSGVDAERFKRDHSKTTSWGDEAQLYRG